MVGRRKGLLRNVNPYVYIYIECTHIRKDTQANAFTKNAGNHLFISSIK